MVLRAFTERHGVVRRALLMIIMGHFWVALAVSFNEHLDLMHSLLYLSGVVVAGVVAYACILWLRRTEKQVKSSRFHGHVFEHPRLALVFLLSWAWPGSITTSFVGGVLVFAHPPASDRGRSCQPVLVIDGLALVRCMRACS